MSIPDIENEITTIRDKFADHRSILENTMTRLGVQYSNPKDGLISPAKPPAQENFADIINEQLGFLRNIEDDMRERLLALNAFVYGTLAPPPAAPGSLNKTPIPGRDY